MSIKKNLLQQLQSVKEYETFALVTESTGPPTTQISFQHPREGNSRWCEEQAHKSIRRFKELTKLLKRWLSRGANRHGPKSNWLCHFLDEDYTKSNISLEALQKRDLPITQALNSLSSQLGFEIFLAVLDKELVGLCQDPKPVSWYYDYNFDDDITRKRVNFRVLKRVFEKNYRIAKLVSLDGNLIAENLRLNESVLLETDGFKAVKPKVKGENKMDSDPTAWHLFSRTALVIVPQRSLLALFQRAPERGFKKHPIKHPQSAAAFLAKASLRPQAPAVYSDTLQKYCRDRRGMQYPGGTENGISLSEEDDTAALYAGLRLGNIGMLDQVLKEHRRFSQVPRGVIDGILKWLDFADRESRSRFDKIKSRLDILVEGGATLSLKVQTLTSFASPHMQENPSGDAAHLNIPEFVLAWIRASTGFHEKHQKFATEPAGKSMLEYSQIAARLLISETNFARLGSWRDYSPFSGG
ncbi:unnamed protein product [Clonostachys byssicola]|uniref:Uncharacterized protein n=1 Tax=Clonostachys byssicola TaxID=160290 RepID=A0A9N9UH53_9HYPO|nr:unnamed protein product [Clonostachys byssicola]